MSLSSPPHLEIFNGGQEGINRPVHHQSFTNFSRLPSELRLKIWRKSLERERMIQICVHPIRKTGADSHAEVRYGAAVRGRNVLSKLLRVNREARSEVFAFYRIQIPCYFTRGSPEQERDAARTAPRRDTLLFNPELDVLEIIFYWIDYTMIADFLLNLRERDNCHVGIRNLAINLGHLPSHGPAPEWLPPLPDAGNARTIALRELFSGLHEIFLITTPSLGRVLVPFCKRGSNVDGLIPVKLLNPTMPIRAHSPAFTRLPRDPRPVEQDLRQVHTGVDHEAAWQWRAFLARLGIEPSDVRARMSWLLAFSPDQDVHDREEAELFVRKEEDRWAGNGPGPSLGDDLKWMAGREVARADTRAGDDLTGIHEVAFGYWLFPLDHDLTALGKGAEIGEDEDRWDFTHHWLTRPLQDMSGTWPGLCVADLA